MTARTLEEISQVGPVLTAGTVGEAIVEAITSLNPNAVVVDRGSYIRVLCPHQCVLTAQAVSDALGEEFHFPGDLEQGMPSFRGELTIDDTQAIWEYHGRTDR
jgi:MmoB/DmpM family